MLLTIHSRHRRRRSNRPEWSHRDRNEEDYNPGPRRESIRRAYSERFNRLLARQMASPQTKSCPQNSCNNLTVDSVLSGPGSPVNSGGLVVAPTAHIARRGARGRVIQTSSDPAIAPVHTCSACCYLPPGGKFFECTPVGSFFIPVLGEPSHGPSVLYLCCRAPATFSRASQGKSTNARPSLGRLTEVETQSQIEYRKFSPVRAIAYRKKSTARMIIS